MIWVMNFKNEMRDVGGGGLVTRAGMGWSIVIRMRMKLCMASGTAICASKYQWEILPIFSGVWKPRLL